MVVEPINFTYYITTQLRLNSGLTTLTPANMARLCITQTEMTALEAPLRDKLRVAILVNKEAVELLDSTKHTAAFERAMFFQAIAEGEIVRIQEKLRELRAEFVVE